MSTLPQNFLIHLHHITISVFGTTLDLKNGITADPYLCHKAIAALRGSYSCQAPPKPEVFWKKNYIINKK